MKKQLILTIDEDIIEKAKSQIPNISGFVEQCLRNYLGETNGLFNTANMHELNQTISRCQLEMFLMTEKSNIQEAREKSEKDKINYAWRQVYAEYRDTRTFNPDKMKHAVEVLGVPEDELVDIIEVLFAFQNETNIDVTDWESVYNEYGDGS